jgi:ribonuclease HI
VGNGEKINIYTDPWIPSSPDKRIITPRGDVVYTKVHELIDPTTGVWDEELLRNIFYDVDVNRILQIPLHNHGFDDFIAWAFTKHGRYTIRSGYHTQWRHSFGPRAGHLAIPGTSAMNPVWKSVWRLKIPSKIKIFLWRALHGILPLKSILVNRHVGTSGQCPICSIAPEDIMHLLFQCDIVRQLWTSLGLSAIIDEASVIDRSGSVVLEQLMREQDKMLHGFDNIKQKETIGVACWYLWWIWHRRTHNDSVPPLSQCKMSVLSITANAAKAMSKIPGPKPQWVRPNPRQVKINVDGSFHLDTYAGSVGAVMRDSAGRFIAASIVYLPNVASAAAAKTMAMREGLALANRLGCNNVLMESDSIETVEACSGDEAWWGENSAIYADYVDLAALLGNVTFKYCPREANRVAHEIARFCFSSRSSCIWVDEPLSFLLEKLINDVTEL